MPADAAQRVRRASFGGHTASGVTDTRVRWDTPRRVDDGSRERCAREPAAILAGLADLRRPALPTPLPEDATPMSTDAHARQLSTLLQNGNAREAVALLNSLTDFRFTSLFRYDGDWLRFVAFHDRCNPEQDRAQDLPVVASYCQLVRETQRPVEIRDSLDDARVAGHPKRPIVRSYCSAPIFGADGALLGTACHYDYDVRAITTETVDGLALFARVLAERPASLAALAPVPAGLQATMHPG